MLISASNASAARWSRRLAERGPATLLVGTIFTLGAPPSIVAGVIRGGPVRLPGCRFGHGVKMLAASAIALPVGLLLAPFHWQRLPGTWMDSLVDAQQEDYCTRPPAAILP